MNEQTNERTNKRTNERTGRMLRQQPTLWSDVFQAERGWGDFADVFQAERGWGDFDDNDYVKHYEDEARRGQGKQLGGWLISNMTTRMTTRRGLGPGI
jgi:hypothetical protein